MNPFYGKPHAKAPADRTNPGATGRNNSRAVDRSRLAAAPGRFRRGLPAAAAQTRCGLFGGTARSHPDGHATHAVSPIDLG
jgi:hypothetical protein